MFGAIARIGSRSHYVMTFADGVIDTHVITAARRFAGASAYGARQLDEYAVH